MMPKIAIVGSPNVGKSVTFGRLTGNYVTVSNYPGTTVEITRGHAKIDGVSYEVIDTPGLYSVFPVTEEERVALNLLTAQRPDVIVHVVDTKHLARALPLTFQIREMGFPVILVLNMFDEALSLGMTVDTAKLSDELNCSVVATVAITGQGANQLLRVLSEELSRCKEATPMQPVPPEFSERAMRMWHRRSQVATAKVVRRSSRRRGMTRFDKILIFPLTGLPILAAILYFGLYRFVGVFGAGTVVDILEGAFETHLNPWMTHLAERTLPWGAVRELFVGEYGVLTLGMRYAVAIILPIVGLFFLVFAVIEDSGYLPRLALLLDRAFKRIGLSGRAVIPLVLGLGCDTMATVVTRTLPTQRERIISTLLLALCIPCSAQLGVILGILSATPSVLIAWFIIIGLIFALVGALMGRLLPGRKPSFIMEIPPMRMPRWSNVLIKTVARMKWYFKEVVPFFVLASVIIWLFKMVGAFDYAVSGMSPLLSAMDLPPTAAKAFIFGFFRRDYGAAGLYDLHTAGAFTNNQLLTAVVVLTLFLPCIAQFLITIKERGWKMGFAISAFVLCVAFGVGVTLGQVMPLVGINF